MNEITGTTVLRVNRPIGEKQELIKLCMELKKKTYVSTANIGLVNLSEERIDRLFQPYFKLLGIKGKVDRAWFHFMQKGGQRTNPHAHQYLTAIYYLKIPPGSSKMFFPDNEETVDPVEDDFIMFAKDRQHGITEHQSDKIRLAIGADVTSC